MQMHIQILADVKVFQRKKCFKVACTSGPFFEKIMKRYPIFSLQMNYQEIDQMHK